MPFDLKFFDNPKNKEKLKIILKNDVCNNCLGRQFGMIGHGMTNSERGKIIRNFVKESKEPTKCFLCNNFFRDEIEKVTKNVVSKFHDYEFKTYLIGSVIPDELEKRQEELWEKTGVEDVEPIKSEVNREVGKLVEKLSGKKFDSKLPDATALVNLSTGSIRLQIRSLFVYGKYQKLARGIPQTKWICSDCGGKGCKVCHGTGKLYKTSVQEIIEKPFLKAVGSSKSAFHGGGREDIDARNLAWRPFVIELVKPEKRKIDLKKLQKAVNKSNKVKVSGLKFADKEVVRKVKFEKLDKTYEAVVDFEKEINKKLLPKLKTIIGKISQQTPQRVVHRRANLTRFRRVKKFSYKILGKKKMKFRVLGESGLYIKELISGDNGRTKPNVADLLNNKVKKISLDVVKIHTK